MSAQMVFAEIDQVLWRFCRRSREYLTVDMAAKLLDPYLIIPRQRIHYSRRSVFGLRGKLWGKVHVKGYRIPSLPANRLSWLPRRIAASGAQRAQWCGVALSGHRGRWGSERGEYHGACCVWSKAFSNIISTTDLPSCRNASLDVE